MPSPQLKRSENASWFKNTSFEKYRVFRCINSLLSSALSLTYADAVEAEASHQDLAGIRLA